MIIQHTAVIGAGTMGRGLARLLTKNGQQVSLYDPDTRALAAAKESVAGLGGDALRLLRITNKLEDAVRDADLVIEAGPESLAVKQGIYRTIAPVLEEHTIVASNTSSLPLSELAKGQPFADRMIIMHFFNPPDIVPLVEIVGLPGTEEGIVEQISSWLIHCGKVPVTLKKDCPGFIANRLQAAVLREACYLLEQGIADAGQIDLAMTEGPGLRWAVSGPFEIADYGGLDIWKRVADNLFPELHNGGAAPAMLNRLAAEGKLGMKTGAGFYDYEASAERRMSPAEREQKLRRLADVKLDRIP